MNFSLSKLGLGASLGVVGWALLVGAPALAQTQAAPGAPGTPGAAAPESLDEIVVTASAFPEERSRIASTIQVIGQDQLQRSGGYNLTDILAESGAGFLSEWSADQTQINIRGGLSDGQGRDYLSDVLVLVNGRRAGTANISKLSQDDVARVEIVRGPASVLYGSQNIGGVVNIILKDGANTVGGMAQFGGGSSDLVEGHLQQAGKIKNLDFYLGVSAGGKGDYDTGAGGGVQLNSQWHRAGASAALGFDLDPNNRIEFEARSDGCYSCGFRGSQENIYDRDDRSNASIDLTYQGHTTGKKFQWSSHLYAVDDADLFNWASPIVVSSNKPAPGTSLDDNRRYEEVIGNQLRGQGSFFSGNTLIAGWDTEYSQLRSRRFRIGVPGTPAAQVAPYDNNQHESVNGLYAEDAQSLLDDRLTLRGGVRWTKGSTTLDPTPNLTGVIFRTEPYEAVTYSAGAAYKALPWWLLHFGASSGFRAPDATQLAGDFTAVGGGRTFGNPDLTPETSHQIEFGSTISRSTWSLETVLFQNVITNRFITAPIAGVANTSQYINAPGNEEADGIEFSGTLDAIKAMKWKTESFFWTLSGDGYWNFSMVDQGAAAGSNTRTMLRSYRYEASLNTRFGQTGGPWRDWSVSLTGLLRGPVYINAVSGPEYLQIPQEFLTNYYLRKDPFWVMNAEGDVSVTKNIQLQFIVRNVLNINQSPIFFGLDKAPYLADPKFLNGGGPGNSMEGRNYEIRLRATWG